jgi:hypothetical protein
MADSLVKQLEEIKQRSQEQSRIVPQQKAGLSATLWKEVRQSRRLVIQANQQMKTKIKKTLFGSQWLPGPLSYPWLVGIISVPQMIQMIFN